MAGIFTRGALDKIMANADLTPEQRTEQVFSLYGRALDDGYVSKSAAEEAKQAAIEATKAGFKAPDPIDPKATPEYQELMRENEKLRTIGGAEFSDVLPQYRDFAFGKLDRGEKAKPISEQLTEMRQNFGEIFTPKQPEPQQKPTFGAPTEGSMPKGETGAAQGFADAWGFIPKAK